MFFWQDRRQLPYGYLERCFTDSLDGVSEAPFSGLNLGRHVGDDDRRVEQNRGLLGQALEDTPIAWMNQVHGVEVAEVTHDTLYELRTADAMVTRESGLALAVMVADCSPVVFHDDEAGVVGVAHAGRPGMLGGIIGRTVEAMRDLGVGRLEAVVGPSVCGRCYEVPQEMTDEAALRWPASAAVTWTGTPAIDVAAGVVSQLAALDVSVTWLPGCTRETPTLYSYRRDGQTGRFAGLVRRHLTPAQEMA